jgi:hypothetical protein
VTIETTHFSYFTIAEKRVEAQPPPIGEFEEDEGDECGTTYWPAISIAFIGLPTLLLIIVGHRLDKQDREQEYRRIP